MAAKEPEETRKDYLPPKIVHTEKVESRAVTCLMADDNSCAPGPIQS